jgi:hypothetical protein
LLPVSRRYGQRRPGEQPVIQVPLRRAARDATPSARIPPTFICGVCLIALWWPIAWLQPRPLSDYSFFPLWLGYILSIDGLVKTRSGTSPITRNGWRWALAFVVSVGLWWVFEAFNHVLSNWHYLTPRAYGTVAYAALASLAFSTVIPAVLTTAELVRSFGWDPLRRLPPLRQTRRFLLAAHLAGWLMLVAIILAPGTAFPLVWLSLIFLLDPITSGLGGRSLGSYLDRGDWTPVINLALGGLVCGWFWEMWNFYSMPKWRYSVPHAGFARIFEMPLLGYGGYIPFGIEVFVFYGLVAALVRRHSLPRPLVGGTDAANVRGNARIESPEAARL